MYVGGAPLSEMRLQLLWLIPTEPDIPAEVLGYYMYIPDAASEDGTELSQLEV
jgi:hypothetical protein